MCVAPTTTWQSCTQKKKHLIKDLWGKASEMLITAVSSVIKTIDFSVKRLSRRMVKLDDIVDVVWAQGGAMCEIDVRWSKYLRWSSLSMLLRMWEGCDQEEQLCNHNMVYPAVSLRCQCMADALVLLTTTEQAVSALSYNLPFCPHCRSV